jgi:uncharacterized membrane protein
MFQTRPFVAAGALVTTFVLGAAPASAELDGCNKTNEKIYVAAAHNTDEGWISLGWWAIEPNSCMTMLEESLQYRYYYVYAEAESGRTWGGSYNFCIQNEKFDIVGADDCDSRGYETAGFHEHDVGGTTDYTVLFGP